MKKTMAAIIACTIIGGSSLAYAQSSNVSGSGEPNDMATGRATTPDQSNNAPGTTAGTPTHSVPANSSNTGTANLFNSGK